MHWKWPRYKEVCGVFMKLHRLKGCGHGLKLSKYRKSSGHHPFLEQQSRPRNLLSCQRRPFLPVTIYGGGKARTLQRLTPRTVGAITRASADDSRTLAPRMGRCQPWPGGVLEALRTPRQSLFLLFQEIISVHVFTVGFCCCFFFLSSL